MLGTSGSETAAARGLYRWVRLEGPFSKSIGEEPAGSWLYRRRMSGMRCKGMPMPIMSCTEGMFTLLIHSVTGCSTCDRGVGLVSYGTSGVQADTDASNRMLTQNKLDALELCKDIVISNRLE